MENKKDRLLGVKAIANYLDTSIRNLYRWERELGLPLRRVGKSKGRSVFVLVEELDEWIKQGRIQITKKKGRWKTGLKPMFLILLIIASIVIALFLSKTKNEPISRPVTSSIDGKHISIKDQEGKIIWSYVALYSNINKKNWQYNKTVDFIDLDNDGANEVIASVYDTQNDGFYLVLFDNDGTVLWQRQITSEQTFYGIRLKSDFRPIIIAFGRLKGGEIYAITSWIHRGRFLSIITSHDRMGNLVSTYHHVGHLSSIKIYDLDNDGNDEILFAGTNNLLNGEGVLGVLLLSGFKGICPPNRIEQEYRHLAFRLKPYIADNPQPGNQSMYLRFKKTHHLSKHQRVHAFARLDNIDKDLIHVEMCPWVIEQQKIYFGLFYTFTNEFKLKYLIPSGPTVKLYPDLLKQKETDIPLKELVEIYSGIVYRWGNGNWIPVLK